MNEPISANREYKDSVFRMLYNKPETVLPLYSIKEGILADFLLSQRSEVIAMSIFEYDHEEELKKLGAMEREEGREEGIVEGQQHEKYPCNRKQLFRGRHQVSASDGRGRGN